MEIQCCFLSNICQLILYLQVVMNLMSEKGIQMHPGSDPNDNFIYIYYGNVLYLCITENYLISHYIL